MPPILHSRSDTGRHRRRKSEDGGQRTATHLLRGKINPVTREYPHGILSSVKKTNDSIKKMKAAHEKQAAAIRKKPVYDRVSEELDVECHKNCVKRARFSSAVLRGRLKATKNPSSAKELEAEVTAVRTESCSSS